ncbi:N-formylglutamate amidohydrolase [Piscinibacter koreensis]|uniref:N-formylglutamate amidohydrolase n=1 Tax=Piscinibacter koreensis TaxID=2742824 RepID=A0A7Y6TX03_9BURK|nr:N-formylglutamate amidohydrolase [Schlegelella koreensis]
MSRRRLFVSSEHGGCDVPREWQPRFAGHEAILHGHRGWDPGSLQLAREMATVLDAPLVASTTTRLLVDLNRSIWNPALHGEMIRDLPAAERQRIIAQHWRPHRNAIEGAIDAAVATGDTALHIASHSFVPELDGEVRHADVGFLYDPARPGEVAFAAAWRAALRTRRRDLLLRRNYPYQGKGDGLTSTLRKRHPPDRYVGLELEVNQRFMLEGGRAWHDIRAALVDSLREALDATGAGRPGLSSAAPAAPPARSRARG